jgi:hypothetical protein
VPRARIVFPQGHAWSLSLAVDSFVCHREKLLLGFIREFYVKIVGVAVGLQLGLIYESCKSREKN